jgi:hypothetical protein
VTPSPASPSDPNRPRSAVATYALGILLAFGALNSFAGGWYEMSGAPGIPKGMAKWHAVPRLLCSSLILCVVVGGAFLFGAVATLARLRFVLSNGSTASRR